MTAAPPCPVWLPVLEDLLVDERSWGYVNDRHGPRGYARLRVWDVIGEAGVFAVVTETGAGLSVTSAAAAIYATLQRAHGGRLGLAELWPEGHSGPAHLDAVVQDSGKPHGVSWTRLWPAGTGGAVGGWKPEIARDWWLMHAERILAP